MSLVPRCWDCHELRTRCICDSQIPPAEILGHDAGLKARHSEIQEAARAGRFGLVSILAFREFDHLHSQVIV